MHMCLTFLHFSPIFSTFSPLFLHLASESGGGFEGVKVTHSRHMCLTFLHCAFSIVSYMCHRRLQTPLHLWPSEVIGIHIMIHNTANLNSLAPFQIGDQLYQPSSKEITFYRSATATNSKRTCGHRKP